MICLCNNNLCSNNAIDRILLENSCSITYYLSKKGGEGESGEPSGFGIKRGVSSPNENENRVELHSALLIYCRPN